jgi:hypothetical protein
MTTTYRQWPLRGVPSDAPCFHRVHVRDYPCRPQDPTRLECQRCSHRGRKPRRMGAPEFVYVDGRVRAEDELERSRDEYESGVSRYGSEGYRGY